MDGLGWKWRGSVLKPGEGRAIWGGELLWERGLEDAQRLAHLHGAALELAEDLEHLLCRALLEFGGDGLRGLASDALAETEGGAAGVGDRKCSHLHASGEGIAREIDHVVILACLSRCRAVGVRPAATAERMRVPGKPSLRSGGETDFDRVISPLIKCRGVISPLPDEEDGLCCNESGEQPVVGQEGQAARGTGKLQ